MASILIVDDDPQVLKEIAGKLAACGHTCHVSNNGETALELLNHENIDLLILDVMIPGISGFELCRRIHTNTELYALPILFVSAMNGEEEIAHGLAQGADDYLTKPFKTENLISRVQNLLSGSTHGRLIDELTALPGPKQVKLDIQKNINLKQHFAAIYIELLHINELGRLLGAEARARSIRHLARGLTQCGGEFTSKYFTVGHMGGGHFLCLIEPPLAEDYCRTVRKLWRRHMPALHESLGIGLQQAAGAGKGLLELELLFCIAVHEPASRHTTQDLFETLTHLRQSALAASGAGIYFDRRH